MLKKRWFEHDDNGNIKMFSQYDNTDLLEDNYKQRMSGDDGYIDEGKDFMKVARIPIEFIANLSNEQKTELEHEPKALLRILKEHPEFRTNSKRI